MPECGSELVASTSNEPVSSVLTKTSVPLTWANGLDSDRITTGAEGAELSTVTVRVPDVNVFPAWSVVITRSS